MFSTEFGSQRYSGMMDDEGSKTSKSELLTDAVRELDINDINKEIHNALSTNPSSRWDLDFENTPKKKFKIINKIRSKFNLKSKSGREKYVDFLRDIEQKSKSKRNKLILRQLSYCCHFPSSL